MPLKKPLQFKKKPVVKPQSKKEYKEVVKPKKEVISDPDKYMSVCFSREQLYKIKCKMTSDIRLVEYINHVLELQV